MQLSGVYNRLGGPETSELHPPRAPPLRPSEENSHDLPGVQREPEAQSVFSTISGNPPPPERLHAYY